MSGDEVRRRNELREVFARESRFTWEKGVGSGSSGFAVLVKETDDYGNIRRFVVKRSSDEGEEDDNEIAQEKLVLLSLRWAEHIVNLVDVHNNPLEPRDGQGGIQGAWIIMEYMENGTLGQFLERAEGILIPNRMLWFMFQCMIRACVGMAYSPLGPFLPETPLENYAPSLLSHQDMTTLNLMFGSLRPGDPEHYLVPILKLIDFGFARVLTGSGPAISQADVAAYDDSLGLSALRVGYGRSNAAIHENILAVGIAMTRIITFERLIPVNRCRREILDMNVYPSLDRDLRLLIVRCLAVEPLNRPPLEELLAVLHGGIYTKNAAAYVGTVSELAETDDNIRGFVQEYILNANVY
ncbi:kinase-like domain-containing protein [Hypoxylon crocopeplum]|nr:kinase-like domain-containing protein [Hypoxylon crocopeplum]